MEELSGPLEVAFVVTCPCGTFGMVLNTNGLLATTCNLVADVDIFSIVKVD